MAPSLPPGEQDQGDGPISPTWGAGPGIFLDVPSLPPREQNHIETGKKQHSGSYTQSHYYWPETARQKELKIQEI